MFQAVIDARTLLLEVGAQKRDVSENFTKLHYRRRELDFFQQCK